MYRSYNSKYYQVKPTINQLHELFYSYCHLFYYFFSNILVIICYYEEKYLLIQTFDLITERH